VRVWESCIYVLELAALRARVLDGESARDDSNPDGSSMRTGFWQAIERWGGRASARSNVMSQLSGGVHGNAVALCERGDRLCVRGGRAVVIEEYLPACCVNGDKTRKLPAP